MIEMDQQAAFIEDVQHNCNISDARDHGIYAMCTMVLKLRNLYKWEHGLEPWQEAEPAELLDWIEAKENYWPTIAHASYRGLVIEGGQYTPGDPEPINVKLEDSGLVYGAGYGRSMKAVFFLSHLIEKREIEGCPVLILGKEEAKEMSSPLAMVQDGIIYLRREPLRFFFWDQIQELRSSCRDSFRHALHLYGLLLDDSLDHNRLRQQLDTMVEEQIDLFIHHEVGEIKQETLSSDLFRKIIGTFPGSVIELVTRSIKDILADTHPKGLLSYVIRERKETSLSIYVGLLDGLRRQLFPQAHPAWKEFIKNGDWSAIEQARVACREQNLALARTVCTIAHQIDSEPKERLEELFEKRILVSLGVAVKSS